MDSLELTYERYVELGGRESEDVFRTSLPVAKAAVREVIGFNLPQTDRDREALERALMSAIRVDVAYGQSAGIAEGAGSFSIGSFSEGSRSSSSTSSSVTAYDADMRRAIRSELIGSAMLYQGIF